MPRHQDYGAAFERICKTAAIALQWLWV